MMHMLFGRRHFLVFVQEAACMPSKEASRGFAPVGWSPQNFFCWSQGLHDDVQHKCFVLLDGMVFLFSEASDVQFDLFDVQQENLSQVC